MGKNNFTLPSSTCIFKSACGRAGIPLGVLPTSRQMLHCVQGRLFGPISDLKKPYFPYHQRLIAFALFWDFGLFYFQGWGSFLEGLTAFQTKKLLKTCCQLFLELGVSYSFISLTQ